MEPLVLTRNPQAFRVQLFFVAIATLFVGLIAAFVVGSFFKFAIGSYAGSRILTFLVIVFISGFASMIAYIKWNSKEYRLSPEGIVVTGSVGALGKKQKIYLYESIISVSFNQNYFGAKYGYGDMHVTIPKLKKS